MLNLSSSKKSWQFCKTSISLRVLVSLRKALHSLFGMDFWRSRYIWLCIRSHLLQSVKKLGQLSTAFRRFFCETIFWLECFPAIVDFLKETVQKGQKAYSLNQIKVVRWFLPPRPSFCANVFFMFNRHLFTLHIAGSSSIMLFTTSFPIILCLGNVSFS